MKKPKITGIGCFAKPETLTRVLKKVLEDYIPQEENLPEPVGSQAAARLSMLNMLRDNFVAPTGTNRSGLLQSIQRNRITGFFVWIKDCCLAISVFIRDDWGDRYTFTVRLNGSSVFQDGRLSRRSIRSHNPIPWVFEQTAEKSQETAVSRMLEHRF